MKLKFCSAIVGCALLFAGISSSFGYDFKTPYSHYSDGEGLESVLSDFARQMNFNSRVSKDLSGIVSGRFTNVNPNDFLKGFKSAYGVRYYVSNGTINFYHENEWEQSVVNVGTAAQAQTLYQALNNSGVIPAELPLGLKGSIITIQGPKSHIDTVKALINTIGTDNGQRLVMKVFKLKHAKADDTEVTSMNKKIIVPGVASILQKMVSGTSEGTSLTGVPLSNSASSVGKLRGTGLAAGDGNIPVENMESAQAANGVKIMADSRLNAVVVSDVEFRMPYYKQVISDLDQPVKLVELHAAIVDVDINAVKNLGVAWQGRRASGSSGKWNIGGGVGDSSLAWAGGSTISNSTNGGVFSTVFNTSRTNFFATINMLETDQKAQTLGRPSMMTMDNVEATLEDTTTRYVKVAGYQDVDLFKVESGTVLQVTPHIIERGPGQPPYISMVINIQSNQDNSSENGSTESDELPPIKQTKINTRAVVEEGQSLLIGGYYVEYKEDMSSGVPGAKDVPVVGKLFGTEGNTKFRRERLILITPKILDLGEAQALPQEVYTPDFAMSGTSDSYIKRPAKKADSSGCSSNRASSN